MARKLRIAVLLFILATVAHQAWWQGRDLDWKDNLYVALYPINVDNDPQVADYIAGLTQADFDPITTYFSEQSGRYGLPLYQPLAIRLGPQIQDRPPPVPQSRSPLDAIFWSLKFRFWAWWHSPDMPVAPKVRLFLLYHNPQTHPALAHSSALSKGRLGLVNVYGANLYRSQNAVIVAHELLHALGASDKYDRASNAPLYPEGYAEPHKTPRHPQTLAELMGGRIPQGEADARIPEALSETLIGQVTAAEIGWIKRD